MTKLRKQYASRLKKLMRKQKGASRIHTGDMWEVIGAYAELFAKAPEREARALKRIAKGRKA